MAMTYEWPDLVFPPINLWNMPKQDIFRRVVPQKIAARPNPVAQASKRDTLHRLLNAR